MSSSTPLERIVLAPNDRRNTIVDVVRSARHSLVLSLFRCSDYELLEELAACLRRSVRVEVLVTKRAKGWKERLEELWSSLEAMGARVHRYADPVVKYHAKYIVADDALALVGSLNFTRKCFTRTCDFLHLTSDPAVIADLKRLFEVDCTQMGTAPELGPRLVVGPERARRRITGLLEGARRSIHIIDAKVTDPEMVLLLQARAAAGIEVEILSKRKLSGLRSHGKLILIDRDRALIGSLSLSSLSLEFRRELALQIEDPECVRSLDAFYRGLSEAVRSREASSGKSA
jgi:phosphatidylserine/phosphatidylglycerophosphate/cardiolipin synthase-like enzyme